MEFNGEAPEAGYYVEVVLPSGVSFTDGNPNCETIFSFHTIANCAYAGNIFSFEFTEV